MPIASPSSLRRLGAALTTAALFAAVPAAAQSNAPAPAAATPALLRPHQIWLDELPDRIEPSDLEVVVLSPDERCKPPRQKGLFGIAVDPLDPALGALCRRIESFAAAPPEALPLTVRLHTRPLAGREPVELLGAIEPAPPRRYVALVHWDRAPIERNTLWAFEIAVVDRQAGRTVWHGARAHEVWPRPEWQDKTELRALRALLMHELPRDLLDCRWWQADVPVPGSRWIPPAEVAAYRPAADRAGLAVVNSYYAANRLQDLAILKLWPAGSAEIDDTERLRQGDWSRSSTVRRAQSTPELAPDTYVLLDLPAGDYQSRVYTGVEPLALRAGQTTVLNIQRGLGNARVRAIESEAWWREKVLGERGRHAFLAEPPSRGRPAVVPFFVIAPR